MAGSLRWQRWARVEGALRPAMASASGSIRNSSTRVGRGRIRLRRAGGGPRDSIKASAGARETVGGAQARVGTVPSMTDVQSAAAAVGAGAGARAGARAARGRMQQHPALVARELRCHHDAVAEYARAQAAYLAALEAARGAGRGAGPGPPHARVRFLVFDFVLYSHTRLRLSTSTLFLAFNIVDAYAARYPIRSAHFQLLAMTALWIGSKYWDAKNRVATLPLLQALCCNQYSAAQFKDMEIRLLKALDWSLCHIATMDSFTDIMLFLNKSSAKPHPSSGLDLGFPLLQVPAALNVNEVKLGAIMLCELASFDLQSTTTRGSNIAAAAIHVVTLALNYHRFSRWEDLHLITPDPQLRSQSLALLSLVTKPDAFPSSLKYKYMNDNDGDRSPSTTLAMSIVWSLQNYNIQLRLEEFYRSQEFHLFCNSLNASSANSTTHQLSDKASPIASSTQMTPSLSPHTPYDSTDYLSRRSFRHDQTPSPFTSPFKNSNELFSNFNTPDSAEFPSSSFDKTTGSMNSTWPSSNHHSTIPALMGNNIYPMNYPGFQSNPLLLNAKPVGGALPLTPTTPSLLQSRFKPRCRKPSILHQHQYSLGCKPSLPPLHRHTLSTSSSLSSTYSDATFSNAFVKGHLKRPSSTLGKHDLTLERPNLKRTKD